MSWIHKKWSNVVTESQLFLNMQVLRCVLAGIALSDGRKGERIRVKNTGSKREIEAYVSDKQHVLVTL